MAERESPRRVHQRVSISFRCCAEYDRLQHCLYFASRTPFEAGGCLYFLLLQPVGFNARNALLCSTVVRRSERLSSHCANPNTHTEPHEGKKRALAVDAIFCWFSSRRSEAMQRDSKRAGFSLSFSVGLTWARCVISKFSRQ